MKLFIALCILWLLPFIITSFFNQPAIDDFWNANTVIAHGRWNATGYFYQTASARYSANFIMSLCNTLPRGNVWIFKIWPVIIIVFLLFSFCFLYASVFNKSLFDNKVVCLAFLFVILHISSMRSLFEGLYWMSSTVCYQLAIGLFAIAIAAIIKDSKTPSFFLKLIAVITSLILPGTTEIIIPVYILSLLIILYLSYKFHSPKSLICYSLIISIVLLLFILVSKGNLARIKNDSITYNPHFAEALLYAIKSIAYYAVIWMANPLTIVSFILIFIFISKNLLAVNLFSTIKKSEIIVLILYFLLASVAVYLPLHLFESSLPFPRITTLYFFLFFHLLFFIVLRYSYFILPVINKMTYFLNTKHIMPALLSVFVICAFTNRNFVFICKDLFDGTATKFNEETYQRYYLIKNCEKDTCYVPAHQNWPYFAQLSKTETSNPNYFQHMNVFFKKIILFR